MCADKGEIMNKPELIENYTDNGELSHYSLIDPSNSKTLYIHGAEDNLDKEYLNKFANEMMELSNRLAADADCPASPLYDLLEDFGDDIRQFIYKVTGL